MDTGDEHTSGAPVTPPEGSEPPLPGEVVGGIGAAGAADGLDGISFADGLTVAAPSVVAVVVTHDAGGWLERALVALGAQDYPDLTVLVLDAGSAEDPTERVAAALGRAYVRRLEGDPGFATAANEALAQVEGATFLFVCHDDVVPDPDAIRLLVEEAYRSNAAIVGPKLVGDDDPRLLLEVGKTVDRFGSPHSEIEPGELDQEQHDGVRDVFCVSSAAMLVRADLFAELGGFDPATFPGSEDVDLCWRARIAGARVMVSPNARVRHRRAAAERGIDDVASHEQLERGRLRALLVAYSRPSLLLHVPWTLVHTFLESLAFLATRRVGRAAALWRAWGWNLRHLSGLRQARRRAQALRRVPDRELRPLQARGSARARRFLARRLKTEQTVLLLGDTGRAVAERASAGAREPVAIALAVVAFLYVLGSRGLAFDGIPQVGQFADWSSASELLRAFGAGWRETLLGSPTPAPPVFALMAASAVPVLGAVGLVETLVVLACLPVGVLGTARLVRGASAGWVPGVAAGLAYALLPVWRNAIANGRLGPLLLLALAPFLARALLAAAGAEASGAAGDPRIRRHRLGLVLVGTLAIACYPPAALFGLALAAALALAAPLVGGLVLARRVVTATLVAIAGALVLLVPWSLAVLAGGPDAGSLGFGFRARLDLGEVLRMSSGPAGSRWSALGLLVGALLVLVIARGPRLVWGVRAWALALVGFALTWLPARLGPGLPVPAAEATLTVFALGVAAAVGIGIAAFVEDLRGRHFGWRQGASLVAFVAVVVSSLGFLGDATGGRWHAPGRDWPAALAFVGSDEEASFRVLWVGDPTVLPFDAVVDGSGLGYVLTVDGAGDATDLLRAPAGSAEAHISEAIDDARDRRTARLGHRLAPMAVRYVVVPERVGPRSGARAAPPADLLDGLEDQVDLGRLVRADDDVRIYENTAWIPMEALVAEVPAADAERAEPTLVGVDPDADDDAAPDADAAAADDGDDDAGAVLLWSQASDGGWSATAGGERLERVETFGWANGFEGADADTTPTWDRQWQRNLTVALQVLLVVGLVVWLAGSGTGTGRLRRRGRRRRGTDPAHSGDPADADADANADADADADAPGGSP